MIDLTAAMADAINMSEQGLNLQVQLSPGLEFQIIKVHLQKVSDTNKVVLYLVINEIVEFALTEKEKAVTAAQMSAMLEC